jgi:hypothetical protein
MDGLAANMTWFDETLMSELSLCLNLLVFTTCVNCLFFTDPEAITYENFMWGDVGFMTDVRFYGVAPH